MRERKNETDKERKSVKEELLSSLQSWVTGAESQWELVGIFCGASNTHIHIPHMHSSSLKLRNLVDTSSEEPLTYLVTVFHSSSQRWPKEYVLGINHLYKIS